MYYEIDGTNTRIMGSMHLFPSSAPDVPAWVTAAYEWSEELIFECDNSAILSAMQLAEGNHLNEHLPPELFGRLAAIWAQKPSAVPLETLKPWAAFISLPAMTLPCVPGVEICLRGRASTDGKSIRSLETGADIARVLEAFPDSVYAEHMQTMLANTELGRTSFIGIHNAWLGRDVGAVLAAAERAPMWNSPVRLAMLVTRNRQWAAKIPSMIRPARRTLVGVGSLHLSGEESLVTLLRDMGLAISPVTS